MGEERGGEGLKYINHDNLLRDAPDPDHSSDCPLHGGVVTPVLSLPCNRIKFQLNIDWKPNSQYQLNMVPSLKWGILPAGQF